VRRFFIKEDIPSPESSYKQLLAKNQIEWFHDVKTARRLTRFTRTKDNVVYFNAILQQAKY
jgi:hypothetical protein